MDSALCSLCYINILYCEIMATLHFPIKCACCFLSIYYLLIGKITADVSPWCTGWGKTEFCTLLSVPAKQWQIQRSKQTRPNMDVYENKISICRVMDPVGHDHPVARSPPISPSSFDSGTYWYVYIWSNKQMNNRSKYINPRRKINSRPPKLTQHICNWHSKTKNRHGVQFFFQTERSSMMHNFKPFLSPYNFVWMCEKFK
jgi:hypothetical protein